MGRKDILGGGRRDSISVLGEPVPPCLLVKERHARLVCGWWVFGNERQVLVGKDHVVCDRCR